MHSEIYRIAYQLNAEGKNPSVALIRARLSTPTSLPVIVQALQQWKLTPELGKEVPTPPTPPTSEEPSDNESVEQRLSQLESKMEQVLELLKKQGLN